MLQTFKLYLGFMVVHNMLNNGHLLCLNVKEIELYLHNLLKQLEICSNCLVGVQTSILFTALQLYSLDIVFFFAVLLAAGAVQMSGGYRRIKLLLHLSHHHWRPLHQQQKDRDALYLLSGHTTGKVSFNSFYAWFISIRH